jgi:hypothetical protein
LESKQCNIGDCEVDDLPRGADNFGNVEPPILVNVELAILAMWSRQFWQCGVRNFGNVELTILAMWSRQFWQCGVGNFGNVDLTTWQFELYNFTKSTKP